MKIRKRAARHLALYLVATPLLGLLPMTAFAASFAGAGTVTDPYQITTAAELAEMATLVNAGTDADKHYILMNDIDLSAYGSGTGWTPIGDDYGNPFSGTFDGDGHTISGLKIDDDARTYAGLFGSIDGGTVQNLGLTNVSVRAASTLGGLAGDVHNGSAITGCYAIGAVTGHTYDYLGSPAGGDEIGGLIGHLRDSTAERCYATGTVEGDSYVGGLVGKLNIYVGTPVIIGCVALNDRVTAHGAAWAADSSFGYEPFAGRVVGVLASGADNSNMIDCHGYVDMAVVGDPCTDSSGTAYNTGGAAVPTAGLAALWPSLGFDTDPWDLSGGGLPLLAGMGGDSALPGYRALHHHSGPQ